MVYATNFKTASSELALGLRAIGNECAEMDLACVQLYDQYLNYNTISKVNSLCRPNCEC